MGSDPEKRCKEQYTPQFQSTLPVWGATYAQSSFLPPLSISIHAPRVGSDQNAASAFSPKNQFQSTLPVWGATVSVTKIAHLDVYFNPRSPCGERQYHRRNSRFPHRISIHAPRVGSDLILFISKILSQEFQSTLPVWGATCHTQAADGLTDFNPRSPCGERPPTSMEPSQVDRFQSTLPVWGATGGAFNNFNLEFISIHAPRVGSDRIANSIAVKSSVFQSTLPVWGATADAGAV